MSDSYGQSLPDSESLVNDHAAALIELLPTFSTFLATRANLEREYSKKLSEAAGKARSGAVKDALSRGGGGGSNTLEAAYAKLLEQTDLAAREHGSMADALQSQAVEPLATAGVKLEAIRKKHHSFGKQLVAERDRAYSDRDKSKQKYFDACEALEGSRQKKSQAAGKDSKQVEKAERAYELALEDMQIAKNTFLIDTAVANVAKQRRYGTDLPHHLDLVQMLEASTIAQVTRLFQKSLAVEKDSHLRLASFLEDSTQAVGTIDAAMDQNAFMGVFSASKVQAWELPPDLGWEPAPMWHDTGEMAVTPSATVFLQNVKGKATIKLQEITPLIDSKQREIAGLVNLREAYDNDPSLGDASAVLDNLFDSTRQATLLEITQTEQRAMVELIDENLGEEGDAAGKMHTFKPSSFVTPATCAVCAGSVWGKGAKCAKCGIAVHSKCELKVPAGCGSRSAASVARVGSKRLGHRNASSISSTPAAASPSISRSPSIASASTLPPPPARSAPAPIQEAAQETATMLYAYEAQTGFELSLTEGEVIVVLEDEDEAGWRKVKSADGRQGLVPNSYLQLGGAFAGAGGAPADGSAVEEEEEGALVVALFDYNAQGPDELSIREGESARLTSVGVEYGDGWAEASKDGRTGLLPLSYLQL